ncbi:uncharacterized protein EMH_0070130 [Eimeria mitis]|uniref:Uncharacterized protein n=1 Tax=Eimeria mitis TaxID=44415 RepID=U6KAR5_9EIME|nr:uncharacterized protein EMH_0070130 [Eimeria mitis]CDJ35039.1 hypothetical protein, conserved [Eimeria mitis]
MATRLASLLLQVPPCIHMHSSSARSGESDSKLASTRAGRLPRQDQSTCRTERDCKRLEGTVSPPAASHKKRLRCPLQGAATADREVELPISSQWAHSFSVRPNGWVKGIIVLALTLMCLVQHVACVRPLGGDQLEWPNAPQVHIGSNEKLQAEAISLMRHQFSQMANQKVLEAEAEPSLSSSQKLTTKSLVMLQLDGSAASAAGTRSAGFLDSADNLGAVLVGEMDGDGTMRKVMETGLDMRGGPLTAESAPYSFLNWGQIGGMMQSPALAHTGMPVYMPRQVVGTTIGLDFDSPATFHGPLLVLLMVCILIFFVVLLLCCWMVKSKQKHDKYMAEKLPR